MPRTLDGLLVDPIDGARTGRLVFSGERIAAVEELPGGPDEPVVLPGFIDLQIYDWQKARAQGVTGYLATVGTSARGVVERFLEDLPDEPSCLGAHVEGPFLNPDVAGAQAREHIRPVDPGELTGWLETGRVRMVTLAPELHGAFAAIGLIASAGAIPALGHTATNHRTASLAIDEGVRFATHVWNAMSGFRARAPGAIGAVLEDERITLGLIADGRHLHPTTESLTVRAAGPRRIALTSDLVSPPQERPDGRLLGGDRCGAALVRRMAARFGLVESATMASLVPAELLDLTDRGRLAPGFRADLAILDGALEPLETIVAGTSIWQRGDA
jgi:N-acetylglucosamine-6-phosphate deacetylase